MTRSLLASFLLLPLAGTTWSHQENEGSSGLPAGVKSNYFGKPPANLLKSPKGSIELVGILGSKRFRHVPDMWGFAFNHDASRVLSISTRSCKLWDLETGKPVSAWNDPCRMRMVAMTPDGTRAATGGFRSVKLWDPESGKEVAVLINRLTPLLPATPREEIVGTIQNLAFTADGKMLLMQADTADPDQPLFQAWDSRTGRKLWGWHFKGTVGAVCFSSDGKSVLFAGQDADPAAKLGGAGTFKLRDPGETFSGTVRLHDARTGKPIAGWHEVKCEGRIALHPNGKQFLMGREDKAAIFDLKSGKESAVVTGPERTMFTGLVSPDGKHAVWSREGESAIFNLETGKVDITVHPASYVLALFSRDGKQLVCGQGSSFQLWDIETGKTLIANDAHIQSIEAVTLSPDRTRVFSAGSNLAFNTWDLRTAKLLSSSGQEEKSTSTDVPIAISPDGRHFIKPAGRELTYRDVETGKELAPLEVQASLVAFSPDGKMGLTVERKSKSADLIVWDLERNRRVTSFTDVAIESATISPDGKRILTNGPKLWDAQTGKLLTEWKDSAPTPLPKQLKALEFSPPAVGSLPLAFSPDGKHALSPGLEPVLDTSTMKVVPGETHLWEVSTGKQLAKWKWDHEESCVARVFTEDGKRVILAGPDTLALFDAKTGRELDAIAMDGILRSLTINRDIVMVGHYDGTVSVYRLK